MKAIQKAKWKPSASSEPGNESKLIATVITPAFGFERRGVIGMIQGDAWLR